MLKSLDFYRDNLQSLSISGILGDEQETVIVFSRNGETASVETTDSTVFNKLKKCAAISPDEWVLTNVTQEHGETDPTRLSSACFECPKKLISIRSKSMTVREMTDEERAAAAERMRNLRKAKTV